jgi:DNA/RNA endonuclease YhcR with UshA esterase domain
VIIQCPLLAASVLLTSMAWSDCLPLAEARKHVGEIKCITGKVIRVKQGSRGVHFLDFCDDYRLCPFTVVIFPSDLKSVGDVRQLQGRMIEIHGKVKEYDGRAEIVLEEYRQLSGAGARIPPLPKNYDVEKKGRYSAGTFRHPKSKRKTAKRQPAEVVTQEPEDPEQ